MKIIQSVVGSIGGLSVGLVQIRTRESKATGKALYMADLAVFDPSTKTETSYLVGEGNELEIGSQRVRVAEIRPATSDEERGYIVFALLPKA